MEEDRGFLSVACARWARATRELLRVYAIDPWFWYQRIAWAQRKERLDAAREQLMRGDVQLQ